MWLHEQRASEYSGDTGDEELDGVGLHGGEGKGGVKSVVHVVHVLEYPRHVHQAVAAVEERFGDGHADDELHERLAERWQPFWVRGRCGRAREGD